jgi:hypothetical protein
MNKPKLPGRVQNIMLPIIDELAEAGHLRLALKTLIVATRTDMTIVRRNAARARYTRKLEKLMAATAVLETQACQALHPEHSK